MPANEAQPEEWIPEAWDGRRQTKVEPEGRGIMAEPVDRWVIHTTKKNTLRKTETKMEGRNGSYYCGPVFCHSSVTMRERGDTET